MDYIFYRMYCWYKEKEKVAARFSAVLFISAIHMMYIVWPTQIFSGLFSNSEAVFPCLFVGCQLADTILLFRRYNKNKIVLLLKKYRNDWRNSVINSCYALLEISVNYFPVHELRELHEIYL
jgi:hypothetical protein